MPPTFAPIQPDPRDAFVLDPAVVFLNHGSYGACPRAVLDEQSRLRLRLEREPVAFFMRDLEPLLDEARDVVRGFVGARAGALAFVPNATTGVAAVLRSLDLAPGDEILLTDHGYNACANAARAVAARASARVVVAPVPFPISEPDEVTAALLAAVTPRTRLALVDHVTSPTGLVFPIAGIVAALSARGVDTLVDGAHAPGMLPLDVDAIGAAYYTGNLHKWTCAPKGAAFLQARADRADRLRPVVISHGANSPRRDRDRFRLEFDWTGTGDPTAYLTVPAALRAVPALLGPAATWDDVRARCRALLLAARDRLAAALDVAPPAPDAMLGLLAALPLPDATTPLPDDGPGAGVDPLQDALFHHHRVEVPVIPWPRAPRRLVRVSAHLHNRPADYEALIAALAAEGVPIRPA